MSDPEELIAILVHLVTDLLAGLQRHQHQLQMFSRIKNMTKIDVLLDEFFDIFNEALHGGSPAVVIISSASWNLLLHSVFDPKRLDKTDSETTHFGHEQRTGCRIDLEQEDGRASCESLMLV